MDWQPIDGKHFPTTYVDTGNRLESTQCLLWTKDGRCFTGFHCKPLTTDRRRKDSRIEPFWQGPYGAGYREEDFTHFVEILGPAE